MRKLFITISIFILLVSKIFSQTSVDYSNPKEYEIAGITISGVKYLSEDALILISNLNVGQKISIPGDEITNAIQSLWKQGLFSDIKVSIEKIVDNQIYLNIYLQERPRLLRVDFLGIKKTDKDELVEKIPIKPGGQVTDNNINNTKNIIKDYYAEKGFYKTKIEIVQKDDTTLQNVVVLDVYINKFNKTKINEIIIEGNSLFTTEKAKRKLKNTKQKDFYRFYKPSKYVETKFEEDKKLLIAKYNKEGYRDATILVDSVYEFDAKTINIYLKISEGEQYFFRNITWVGNTKYTSEQLTKMLDIKKGDFYDQARLENRLSIEDDAVGNLYLNDGYLFFQSIPRELKIENDSVDLEIMVFEGPQAEIDRIAVSGNTRTNDRVPIRELRTIPGELFSKTDIIRSVRELAQLGSFDPEQLAPMPSPNQVKGTVDIDYKVVERSNDMFELSGGWGNKMFVGKVGLSFNNFSRHNIFNKKAWQPLPIGDGQQLSVSIQASGLYYQLYSISFTEPWFGGKRPNSLSVSLYHNSMSMGAMKVWGASSGVGRRLKWPDDYFTLYTELGFQKYIIKERTNFLENANVGSYNIVPINATLSRSSIDNPLYSRSGSSFTAGLVTSIPFLSRIIGTQAMKDLNLVESYKISFSTSWFNQIFKDLVLNTKFQYGFIGYYNKELGFSPFEGYDLGGSGMGYYTFGKELIGLRGYKDESLTPAPVGHVYTKYTIELRYPVVLGESATIYGLGFMEAGNCWGELNEFNPFDIYRSAGVGARVFLPMLGMLGVDWGWGFDDIPGKPGSNHSQIHFVFGQQF